jgi:hypothetical protein
VEGSAVLQIFLGNVYRQNVSNDLLFPLAR